MILIQCYYLVFFFEHIFEHFYTLLLGFSWNTEKYRTEEIRRSAFSIRQKKKQNKKQKINQICQRKEQCCQIPLFVAKLATF